MPGNRKKAAFFCRGCGHESAKWMGFCPACGEHSPLEEAPPSPPAQHQRWISPYSSEPQELNQVSHDGDERLDLGLGELNGVLGGGLVLGSVVLMAGEPGIGKSTLLLQTAQSVAARGNKVLYVTGEESARQIKLRAQRLGFSGESVFLLAETDVDQVTSQLERTMPALALVDSIQTLYAPDISSGPGSVAQLRECALRLMRWAKANSVPVMMTGHVTKDGSVAGPRVLEHMVDAVLYLEGESTHSYRILRGTKNRFGATDEIGMFQMGSNGLEEVKDPSKLLLSQHQEGAVGSSIVPVIEGSRPVLVEIQALTSPSSLPAPRRVANGVDYNRLLMLVAVLSRRVGLNLSNQDIIVNVAGGLTIREPAADLGIALAIASSLRNLPLNPGLAMLGEVGLTGELRPVPQLQRRLNEASRLNFKRCLVPESASMESPPDGTILLSAPTVGQALRQCMSQRKTNGAFLPTDQTEAERV